LTFTITPQGTLIVTPTSLIFTYQSATTPSSQNLSVSSSGRDDPIQSHGFSGKHQWSCAGHLLRRRHGVVSG
jgi:hypothetical protein